MVKKAKSKPRPVGRPRRIFTPEQVKQIADYAFDGCQTQTIASLMDIPEATLRENFQELVTKQRAKRKLSLRRQQFGVAGGEGDSKQRATMLIWLGKQYLDQANQEHKQITGALGILDIPDDEAKAIRAAMAEVARQAQD